MRILLWTIAAIVVFIALIAVGIYIPPVQDFIFKKVTTTLNEGEGGMHIEYDRLRLSFPARLSGQGIKASLPGDMDIEVGEIKGGVSLLPLISGNIESNGIDVADVKFRMGTPDSALYMNAAVDKLNVIGIDYGLKSGNVSIGNGVIDGGDVTLLIASSDTTATDTTTQSTPLDIVAKRLEIKNLKYFMQMPTTIDSLTATVGDMVLEKGHVSLGDRNIEAQSLEVTGVNAAYIYTPIPTDSAATTTETAATPDSLMWTVKAAKVGLKGDKARYAVNGATATEGFDMNYIEATDIAIEVDSFYNRGASIRVPLRKLAATERCGLKLDAKGLFEIANEVMSVKDMTINTNASEISVNASMGLTAPGKSAADSPITADIESNFALSDLGLAFPAANDILSQLPAATELTADLHASGTMDDVTVDGLSVGLTRLLQIEASGNAAGFDKGFDSMTGNLNLNGRLINTRLIKPSVVEAKLGKGIELHPLSVRGNVKMNHGFITSNVKVVSDSGAIALDGNVTMGPERYSAEISADRFPVQAFMPTSGLRDLSASVKASGKKFNPLAKDAELNGDIELRYLEYNKVIYRGISGNVAIADGEATLSLNSPVPGANITLNAQGNVAGPNYAWNFSGAVKDLDLKKLNMSETPMGGKFDFNGKADFNLDSMLVNAQLNMPNLDVVMNDNTFGTKNIGIAFNAITDQTTASLKNQDLTLTLKSPLGLDSLMSRISKSAAIADSSIVQQRIALDSIAKCLPQFTTTLTVGPKNLITAFLGKHGTTLKSLDMTLSNDSSLNMSGLLTGYVTPSTIVDTLQIGMWQSVDTLNFNAKLNNNPESPGDWADVTLRGMIDPTSMWAEFSQRNFKDETGYQFGLNMEWRDSIVSVHFTPEHPTIGYKPWTFNKSNFISVDFAKKSLNADLSLSNDVSAVRLYTKAGSDSLGEKKTINLSAKDILLQDWIALNPYAPPIRGKVSGDVSLFHRGDTINGNADVNLTEFFYGKGRVGDFALKADIETMPRGYIRARGELDVNKEPVILVNGHINDTAAVEPFMLDLRVDSFPLNVANPFMSDAGLQLSGQLDGDMKVTGSLTTPKFDGFVAFDNAKVKVNMLGADYALGNDSIEVDSGLVVFDKFPIKGANDNPLVIDGTVNMHNMANPEVNLTMDAKNMQLVNTNRARGGAEVFGKVFVDFNANAKGNMEIMRVNADVNVLRSTNVTYILTDATQTLSSRSQSDIVKFVNFADTTQVEQADSIKPTGMLLGIDANLQVQPGATMQVYLSGDGKNRVSLQPQGNLDYTMDLMGAQHVTGRLTINSGYARYTPPLMGEKMFNFQEGSYVAFNGDMMNPILNIKAVDNVKANVTQSGQASRLIYFDVGLAVTGTLEQMDVKFDLSTKDDITVENELSSMSPEQRASAAMNLLITNMYTGPGTTATSNIGGNALYSFLESQLNSWAANNIKGVDLSFGVNKYDSTVDGSTSQTTSYSYRVSKSLFDDRFKIIVGGNYSTDADTDENFSQNLINDIAFEYIINKSGTMTLKLFRHTGYESILEGEVTQTGVGLTYRKRMTTLGQMFWFMRKRYKREMKRLEEERKAQIEEAQRKAQLENSSKE